MDKNRVSGPDQPETEVLASETTETEVLAPETAETAETEALTSETAETPMPETTESQTAEPPRQERTDLEELEAAVEAILFASGEPVRVDRICLALDLERPLAERVLRRLQDYYAFERRGMRLLQMEDTWQFCSSPDYADAIRRAFEIRKTAKLSQPALEVLTIFAYYQPTTRAYVDKLRGVDSSYTVSLLLERKLIEPCGRLQVPGRPHLYRTTKQFLRAFHLTSLDDLPPLPEGGERLRPEDQAAILASEGAEGALLTTEPPEGAGSTPAPEGADSTPAPEKEGGTPGTPPEGSDSASGATPPEGTEEGGDHRASAVDTGDSGGGVPPAVPDNRADSGGDAERTVDAAPVGRRGTSAAVPPEETGEEEKAER